MAPKEFQINLINLQESLLRFAFSLTADKDDAKDLVQDTFLKALKYCDKFVVESNFKAWTYTIMKNTFINNYRHLTRMNIYSGQVKQSSYNDKSEPTVSDDTESSYSAIEITHTIEQLKEIFRIPFKMHLNGYKYKEIADELNLNIGTVKSRIFLSRKKLIGQLKG